MQKVLDAIPQPILTPRVATDQRCPPGGPGQKPVLAPAEGFPRVEQGSGSAVQGVDGRDPARSLEGVTIQTVKSLCGMPSSIAR